MNDGKNAKPHPEPLADDAADVEIPEFRDPAALSREAALEAEVAQLKDQLLRSLADTENLRRRGEREKEDASKYAVATLARDLLPVSDNLRRAIEAVPEEVAGDEAIKNLMVGVEATERELLAVYERRGIKRIDPGGQRFDPNFHQAMFEVPGSGQPAGTVVQVLQPGYVIHDRLLRPALVGVAKGDAGPEPDAGSGRVDTKA